MTLIGFPMFYIHCSTTLKDDFFPNDHLGVLVNSLFPKDILYYGQCFKVYMNFLGILFKCRYWLSISWVGLAVCISELPADADVAGFCVEAGAILGWLQRHLLPESEHRPMSEDQSAPPRQGYWPGQNVVKDAQTCAPGHEEGHVQHGRGHHLVNNLVSIME